jgi:serine phosphatase RsbU (regulator of sigma subunit)
LFFAEYDDATQRLRYANCGHLAALLFRGDGALERLDSTTTVLGLFKEWDCPVAQRRLFPGDTLALYTDGITESFNSAGEEFGEQRLIEALARRPDLRPHDLIASIIDELQQFSSRYYVDCGAVPGRVNASPAKAARPACLPTPNGWRAALSSYEP